MGTLRLVSDPQTKQISFVVEKPREKGAADQVRDVAVTIVQTKGRVLEVIRETQGQTRGEIRDAAAMNRTAMDAALNELLQEGSVLERKNSRRVEYFVPTN
jgi:DNA-binding MarR family transcriptional regulator